MKVLLALCVLVTLGFCAERKRYDGYKVLAVTPKTKTHLDLLRNLREPYNLDFWQEPRQLNVKVHFMISPMGLPSFLRVLAKNGLEHTVFRDNVQEQIDSELERYAERFRNPAEFAFNIDDYNTYDDIMTQLNTWQSSCRSGFTCTVEDLGNSYEGRSLKMFKIKGSGSNRKTIWSDSLIHAREWLAGATLLKILNHLLTSSDSDVTDLLNKYDFTFIPVMNPDGYVYSWGSDRFWRKNREPNNAGCTGTDLNRNYDSFWMHDGTSDDGCSDLYGGPSAASAPETQIVQNTIQRDGANITALISIHTAAYMWLHPYGQTDDATGDCARSPQHDAIYAVAEAAANAAMATSGDAWTYGPICETIYPASGGTCDYAHKPNGGGNIKYTFTPELRGPGFDPGPDAITPSFNENWAAYKALIAQIETNEGGY